MQLSLTTIDIVMMAAGAIFLVIWLGLFLNGLKHNAMFEVLDEGDYPLKEIYGLGYGVLELIRYDFKKKGDRKLRQQLDILYGEKYCEYYLRVIRAQQVTFLVTVFTLAFAMHGLTQEPAAVAIVMLFAFVAFYYYGTTAEKRIQERSDALLKDFSLMFGDQTNQYIIQRSNNSPVLVNLDNLVSQYHDEYAYLFKKIYEFVKNPPSDTSEYLQYPNMARRVLEGFLTFKLPSSKTMIDKVLELENNRESSAVRSIMRLLNNHSHLRVIPGAELSDDIDSISALPDTLNNLMEFIKYHDNRHYDTLASLCDPEYDKDGDAVTIILPPTRIIKLFSMSASAGFGNFLENDPDADDYETTNQDCTFAVRIEGDSMEPDVHNGNIVLVKSCEVVENARRGIVWYDGKCYCKKIVQGKNGIILVSTNSEYKPIPVISLDSYRLFGEVIEIIEN